MSASRPQSSGRELHSEHERHPGNVSEERSSGPHSRTQRCGKGLGSSICSYKPGPESRLRPRHRDSLGQTSVWTPTTGDSPGSLQSDERRSDSGDVVQRVQSSGFTFRLFLSVRTSRHTPVHVPAASLQIPELHVQLGHFRLLLQHLGLHHNLHLEHRKRL